MHALRAAIVAFALLVAGALAASSPARAASCPTQTYLNYNHLAYAAVAIPATVQLSPASTVGDGVIDEPASANGCKRQRVSVAIRAAGSIDPRVAVIAAGRPQTAFVIGYRCSGLAGASYWDCLMQPLQFGGRQYTGTSYPAQPAPRRTLPLGPPLGTVPYHGRTVTVRRIDGVDPSVAVGISGQPSTAFLSPSSCPYSGFSNTPEYDDLLRCLRAPVWFTFDPPGSEVGGTVTGRSDRPVSSQVAGATISLVRLPVVADLVPPQHGALTAVGRVSDQVSVRIPHVAQGLYEAVVSCPACASHGGATLFPAGSFLIAPKPKSSPAIRIVSYAIALALVVAIILTLRTRRSRGGVLQGLTAFLMGERTGPRRR